MKKMKIRIVAKLPLSESDRNRFTELGADYFAISNPEKRTDEEEIASRIGDAEVAVISIATPVTDSVIKKCPQLKMIQTWSTGVDNIDLDSAKKANITVCNVPDFSVQSVAEKTIGAMIFGSNHLIAANQHAKKGGWDFTRFVGVELSGKTLLVVGRGRIGKKVGEIASAFGMNILFATSKTTTGELHQLLSTSDFVSLHCPYTKSSRHLFSDREFATMRTGVILINNGRGGVVDEDALLRAIDEKKVAFAAVDVFENEPPPIDHPLLHREDVFVTPHCAWNTKEALRRLTESTILNVEAFCKGETRNEVKP